MQRRVVVALILCLASALSFAQVKVPNHTVLIKFPDRRASFQLYNAGEKPVVVQVDLAARSNVYQTAQDGLAIIYPRVSRIEPHGTQKISVTWRGKMDQSHYYLARVNTLDESQVQKDRSDNTGQPNTLQVKVGQAFPIHLEAPNTRPEIDIKRENGKTFLVNKGLRGDRVETLRLGSGKLQSVGEFITPGQAFLIDERISQQQITAVKLRRFGWVTIRGQK